jgi:NAD(P)-dependent dehydrogenase (short-subunit alcohol dehydrogenase family)
MEHPFNNQVVLITGAGSGIGRQLALELSQLGAIIAAVDLTPEPLEKLLAELKEHNGAGGWEIADVTSRTALHAAVAAFEKRLGPVAMLIANAGIGIEMRAESFHAEDLEKQIMVNLVGVANSIEAVLPGMLVRGEGHLVAISSLASFRGAPLMAGYCASKAGVNNLMDSLRLELQPCGIHCTTICPGWIRTPLVEKAIALANARDALAPPISNIMPVDVAARRIVWAIRKRRALYAFPPSMAVPVMLGRMLPTRIGDWLMRFMSRKYQ